MSDPPLGPAEIDAAVQFEAANLFPFDTAAAHVRALGFEGLAGRVARHGAPSAASKRAK